MRIVVAAPQDDEELYAEWRCKRCGVCCGSTDGHPCEYLRPDDGKFFCEIYDNRFGYHRTVDGRPFRCVAIGTIIETTGGYAACAYVEEIRRIRQSLGQDASDLGRRTRP